MVVVIVRSLLIVAFRRGRVTFRCTLSVGTAVRTRTCLARILGGFPMGCRRSWTCKRWTHCSFEDGKTETWPRKRCQSNNYSFPGEMGMRVFIWISDRRRRRRESRDCHSTERKKRMSSDKEINVFVLMRETSRLSQWGRFLTALLFPSRAAAPPL